MALRLACPEALETVVEVMLAAQSCTASLDSAKSQLPQCLGAKAGVLPGPKQTVPRAELYALVSLLNSTDGNVEFSCDS